MNICVIQIREETVLSQFQRTANRLFSRLGSHRPAKTDRCPLEHMLTKTRVLPVGLAVDQLTVKTGRKQTLDILGSLTGSGHDPP